jgi:uncharacterized membrane protein affecting hemolysin expression
MDVDMIRTTILALSLLVAVASLIYTWASNRQRASQQELHALREKVDDEGKRRAAAVGELRDRVTCVEADIRNLPNHSQVAELTSNILEVRGDVGGVRDMLSMLGARIERIDNYLMSEVKR